MGTGVVVVVTDEGAVEMTGVAVVETGWVWLILIVGVADSCLGEVGFPRVAARDSR